MKLSANGFASDYTPYSLTPYGNSYVLDPAALPPDYPGLLDGAFLSFAPGANWVRVECLDSHQAMLTNLVMDLQLPPGDNLFIATAVAFDKTNVIVEIAAILPAELRAPIQSALEGLPGARVAFTAPASDVNKTTQTLPPDP